MQASVNKHSQLEITVLTAHQTAASEGLEASV